MVTTKLRGGKGSAGGSLGTAKGRQRTAKGSAGGSLGTAKDRQGTAKGAAEKCKRYVGATPKSEGRYASRKGYAHLAAGLRVALLPSVGQGGKKAAFQRRCLGWGFSRGLRRALVFESLAALRGKTRVPCSYGAAR